MLKRKNGRRKLPNINPQNKNILKYSSILNNLGRSVEIVLNGVKVRLEANVLVAPRRKLLSPR
jgi:hypothetical protein